VPNRSLSETATSRPAVQLVGSKVLLEPFPGNTELHDNTAPPRLRAVSVSNKSNAATCSDAQVFSALIEASNGYSWHADQDYRYTYLSPDLEETLVDAPERVVGRTLLDFMPEEEAKRMHTLFGVMTRTHQPIAAEKTIFRHKNGYHIDLEASCVPVTDANATILGYQGVFYDVAERERIDRENRNAIEILRLLNGVDDLHGLLQAMLPFLKSLSGCEAVGVRLHDANDYPYYETTGFSDEFVKLENSLCVRNSSGQVQCDENGAPRLECMCGNILCGRTDPSKPFFSSGGSFISNWTTNLLATTSDADRQARTRNRCNGEGYESVALVPLRAHGETLGLVQFNDHRKNRFSPTFISLMERLADSIALALAQRQAEMRVKASLTEKEVLLREIHHRVKNNMQTIISILRIHSRKVANSELNMVFTDCRNRIDAMALIHESLYLSNDLTAINLSDYLNKLCSNLYQAYGTSTRKVSLTSREDSLTIGMDQGIALGMVICELVANAFKHAFSPGTPGEVQVSLIAGKENADVELVIQDTGIGLPTDIDLSNPVSLGLDLAVSAVTGELDGTIEVERDQGTRFTICFGSTGN